MKIIMTQWLVFFAVVFPLQAVRYPLIPFPVKIVSHQGYFAHADFAIKIQPQNSETDDLVTYITDYAHAVWNMQINKSQETSIDISIDEKADMELEEYFLSIEPNIITIKAKSTTGAFWGFQTLCQLAKKTAPLTIPCSAIHDFPQFAYRGLHLDVARHMFPIDFIKKYIDLMASYKLNTFHWHLTDDQGWRIEIKSYPKLQKIAAYRDETVMESSKNSGNNYDGKPYGGYYTQAEIKEVVEYARKRHVMIIPEIEMPGHCLAVLAAYPELGCKGKNYHTARDWGIFEDVYCAGNEKTFEFLENVLTEILDLFPSEYIHIGGDEVRKIRWKNCSKCQDRMKAEHLPDENALQSYFIGRIEKFLNSKKRKIIGWDEILEGGVAPNAVVMSWRGIEGGVKAARLGHYAVMSPSSDLYFNYYQSKSQVEPFPIGEYLPLSKVYQYNPIPTVLTEKQTKYIWGVQGNVWTEYLKVPEQVEYMVFPRALALAEIAWTPLSKQNYANFLARLKSHLPFLDAREVNYSRDAIEE